MFVLCVCLSLKLSNVLIRKFVGLMDIALGQIDYILVNFNLDENGMREISKRMFLFAGQSKPNAGI